ncbi:MAG TPA: fluoride efflux transporter CrcB [Burkholderiales bacterium]|nr:fluoride efflux transporter CrcB [Burkholderiales bacterium]
MLKAILAVSIGSAAGGLLRWALSLKLNSVFPSLVPGTLTANLLGGYIVGFAIAYFMDATSIPPEWRLLIITGFCGGLTTFSTFSAEVVSLLQQGQWAIAAAVIAAHVIGSLAMTFLGIASWHWLGLR